MASVMRPSMTMAIVSAKGTQSSVRSVSVDSSAGGPVAQVRGQEQDRGLVGDRVGDMHPRELAPIRGDHAGLLAQLPLRALERRLTRRRAALRDLPRPMIERIPVLCDERHPVLGVDGHDPDRRVLEVDDTVDTG